MLTGSDLLAKVKELGDVSKSDIVRECGYVSTKKDGSERLNFTAFYEALLRAKGVNLDTDSVVHRTSGIASNVHKIALKSETMDADKLIDSVKFLLKGVRQLSDRFVETNENIMRSFESVREDIGDLGEQIVKLEGELQNLRDQQLVAVDGLRSSPSLPVRLDQRGLVIPALNLPLEGLLDVYRTTPALLQPFARACSVTGRTLSGAIPEVELEVFAQGTTWVIETQDGEWVLLPRPGMLERQTHVESLGRMFELEVESPLPAELELLMPGMATVVEHGRRWYLKDKGTIGLHADPLQRSMEVRIRLLEQKLSERN